MSEAMERASQFTYIINAIQFKDFARTPEGNGVKFSLKYFQHLAGWFNWALNVYPLLKPKGSPKTQKNSEVVDEESGEEFEDVASGSSGTQCDIASQNVTET